MLLDLHDVFHCRLPPCVGLFPIYFFARIAKRMRGVVGSLSFDVQGQGGWKVYPIWTHSDRQKKGERGAKIGHFSWML